MTLQLFFSYIFLQKKTSPLSKNIHNGLIFIQSVFLGGLIMIEFVLGMTLLNTILILYFHYQQQEVNKEILKTVKDHHFYYGRPDED